MDKLEEEIQRAVNRKSVPGIVLIATNTDGK